jgi:hypothetical protein
MAIRNGLYLAGRIRCNKVQVESDSSFVVESLQNPDGYAGSNIATMMECRQLALDFANTVYSHCLREANEAAHILACNSFSNRTSSLWESNIPDFISHAIYCKRSVCYLRNKVLMFKKKSLANHKVSNLTVGNQNI